MLRRHLAIGAAADQLGLRTGKPSSGSLPRRSLRSSTRGAAGSRLCSPILEPFIFTSRVEAIRLAPLQAAPHRTFNDDEDQVEMTQGLDAVQPAHGGGTADVIN